MPGKYEIPAFMRSRPRTKIVCTIGPATASPQRLRGLIRAGMSVARLNLSHGDREQHRLYVERIRQAEAELDVPVGILADLPGPRYRIGLMDPKHVTRTGEDGPEGVVLVTGDPFVLTAKKALTTPERAQVWPSGLQRDVRPRSRILIDEDAVELRVVSVDGDEIHCTVKQGGVVQDNKAVTAPGNTSTLDYFTRETTEALDFAIEAGVDFIGLSYIRDTDDLRRVHAKVQKANKRIQLVPKIEIPQAVQNLESILKESDAVMVARGDLGIELPLDEVPVVQKRIIRIANELGKPVITATQMLLSMQFEPSPTRAEVTDVYNAVRDGTDAVMLSEETSIGRHPLSAVRFMARIARRAERYMEYAELTERRHAILRRQRGGIEIDDVIAHGAAVTADTLKAKTILAFTESGSTASRVAGFRPRTLILALSPSLLTGRRLTMTWGVLNMHVEKARDVMHMFQLGSRLALESGVAREGDTTVAVVGLPIGFPGNTNLLRVMILPEP